MRARGRKKQPPCLFSYFCVLGLVQLDLETKLLEGEHREQMNQLGQEQEKLSDMKRRQQEALDTALREREKVTLGAD